LFQRRLKAEFEGGAVENLLSPHEKSGSIFLISPTSHVPQTL